MKVKLSTKHKRNRIIKIISAITLFLVFLIYVVMPVGYGYYATTRYNGLVNETPKDFTDTRIMISRGVYLSAWYKSPQNGSVIILIHGATGTRDGVRAYADILVKHGFGVLAFDLRGHGESDGDGVNGYAWNGTEDIGAAINFLSHQENIKTIGGLGISLGGEVLLGASSTYSQLKAIISDGATYRSLDDYLVLPSRQPIVRSFTTRLMYYSAQFFSGIKPPIRLVDSISEAKNTSFLFIAAGGVEKENEYNSLFLECTKGRSEMWTIEGVGHTQGYNKNPEEYENRIIKFFNEKLA